MALASVGEVPLRKLTEHCCLLSAALAILRIDQRLTGQERLVERLVDR